MGIGIQEHVTVSGAAADTDILFFWGFEGNNPTNLNVSGSYPTRLDYSSGATTGSNPENTPSINSTSPMVGTYDLSIPNQYYHTNFAISSQNIVTGAQGAIGFWFKAVDSTIFTNGGDLFIINNAGYTHYIELQGYVPSGSNYDLTVTINDGSSNHYTTLDWGSGYLSVGTAYFIEMRWLLSTPKIEIYVNNVLKGSNTAAITTQTDYNTLAIGCRASAGNYHLDNFIISQTYKSLYGYRNNTTAPR
jgi:hypothetical protein